MSERVATLLYYFILAKNHYRLTDSLSDSVLCGPLANLGDIGPGVTLGSLGKHLHAHVVRYGRLRNETTRHGSGRRPNETAAVVVAI